MSAGFGNVATAWSTVVCHEGAGHYFGARAACVAGSARLLRCSKAPPWRAELACGCPTGSGCDSDTEGGPTVFCSRAHASGQPLAVLLLQLLRATALIPR